MILKKINFNIQIYQDNFKTVVKQFAKYIKKVNKKLKFQVKFLQIKVVKLFKLAYL